MKISVFMARDKSKASAGASKAPVAEAKGVPARVTTYGGAARSHASEALLVVTRGSVRSFTATAGELKVYLSARAEFSLVGIDPEAQDKAAAEAAGGE